MPWILLSDDFAMNSKLAMLDAEAFRFWLHGLAHCAKNLTDGLIVDAVIPQLTRSRSPQKLVHQLVNARIKMDGAALWTRDEVRGGYVVHDYAEYQPSAHQVRQWRQAKAEARRVAGQRGGQAASAARLIASRGAANG